MESKTSVVARKHQARMDTRIRGDTGRRVFRYFGHVMC